MRKIIIIGFVGCIVVLLLGYTGYRGYKVWKQGHWLAMAREYAAKGDIRNESLSLQQALILNPQSVEACRMMAALSDSIHSPAALVWRQRLLELEPNSLETRLALAQTALNFNYFNVASNALAGVDEKGKNTALYQNAAGVFATGMGQLAEAEKHFAEAVRLDPGNPALQMNLQVMRLHSSNSLDQAAARVEMKRISLNATNAMLRSQAQRELVLDALRYKDLSTAQAVSKELVQPTNSIFTDRLLRVEVLQQAKSPEYKLTLAACQREASAAPAKLSQMAGWMLKNTSASDTLVWLHSLPMQSQTNEPAALLIAECQVQLQDWHGLQAGINGQDWGELEFLRHALLARCLREQNMAGAATAEWGVAVKFASERKGRLIALFRLAAEWRWRSEAEQALWIVVNRYPEEKWAPAVLAQALTSGGRTRSLMELFDTLSKRFPTDLGYKNNLAFTALLLGAQEMNPYTLAQEVYDQAPQNTSYATTYAYALYLQKQYGKALEVMQKLPSKELEDPANAGYYGLILKATGDTQKAQQYLRLAMSGRLFPEEQKMFQQALVN